MQPDQQPPAAPQPAPTPPAGAPMPPPLTPPPVPAPPVPPVAPVPPVGPAGPGVAPATSRAPDSKFWTPKNLGIVFLASLIFQLLGRVPVLLYLVLIVAVIYAFTVVSKLKKGPDAASKADESKALWLMAFSPILTQAIYYYRLRKTHPMVAKLYNRLGWRIVGVEFIFSLILAVIIGAIFAHNLATQH